MQYKRISWAVRPIGEPGIVRRCPKCGENQTYYSSGLFRVNANGRRIDVWLVYRCGECESSFNLPVQERVNPASLPKEVYAAYLSNDAEMARSCAFNKDLHAQLVMDYAKVEICVEGEEIAREDRENGVEIALRCDFALDLPLQKILRDKLGASSSAFRDMVRQGEIMLEGGNILKAKCQRENLVRLRTGRDLGARTEVARAAQIILTDG